MGLLVRRRSHDEARLLRERAVIARDLDGVSLAIRAIDAERRYRVREFERQVHLELGPKRAALLARANDLVEKMGVLDNEIREMT